MHRASTRASNHSESTENPLSRGGSLSGRGGADDRNRTRNLLFTKQLLCRLSYVGARAAAT